MLDVVHSQVNPNISQIYLDISGNKIKEEKLSLYLNEIKNKQALESHIKQLFTSEFEDQIQNILTIKENDFISGITENVKMFIEQTYSLESMNQNQFKDVLNKCITYLRSELYKKNFKILSTAWNQYETTLQVIKKYSTPAGASKNYKISVKNKDNFSFLKQYRKHCRYTDSLAQHSCKNVKDSSKLLEVCNDDNNITHVICIECKKSYMANQIALYCVNCQCKYYSSILDKKENVDVLPATWANYHCSALVNDRMKCIKCRETFYLNLKTGYLKCLNPKCLFETKPFSIIWTCSLCKVEFKSDAKIFNPMEFKMIKSAILQAILYKRPARPSFVPCCLINISSTVFYHKKECKGELYLGELKKSLIIVCEKCHSMNFYNKYTWTCPKCTKRFKERSDENEVTIDNSSVNSNNFLDSSKLIYYPINFPLAQSNEKKIQIKKSNVSLKEQETKLKKDLCVKEIKINLACNPVQESSPNSCASSQNNSFRKHRARTLRDILDERQSSGNKNFKTGESYFTTLENESFTISNFVNEDKVCNMTSFRGKNLKGESIMKCSSLEKSSYGSNIRLIKDKICLDEEEMKNNQHYGAIQVDIDLYDNAEVKQEGTSELESENQKILPGKIKEFVVDDYSIIKLIGEGSYGKIYLIQNKKSFRKFAMKKIIAHDKKEVDIIVKEFELFNAVQHCNIMKIIGMSIKALDFSTFAVYILMELAISDWEKEIKKRQETKKPYTEDELCGILRQLSAALVFLQKNSISHRDIKPQNVLIFEGDIYKLADFGEAKEVKITKQQNTLRGTELYMSPVLFEGLKVNLTNVAHNMYKSDVFSLGYCVLYAATLSFNLIYEIRDVRDMKKIETILGKYLKKMFSSKLIEILLQMVEVDEQRRLDFITLDKLLKEKNKHFI